MKSVIWDRPVRTGELLIFGPMAAHDFMGANWPPMKDACFAIAAEAILAALDGRGSPDVAREKFEAALKSAELC